MLQVSRLSLRYPNGKLALADFDIAVGAGELVIVLGGNGSGKTTLLRCITRTVAPTAGSVRVNGTDMTRLAGERLRRARLELALVSQHASLVRRRSVLANVASGSLGRHGGVWTALGGLPAEELEAAHGHLAEVGLGELAGQRAGTLSGGQAQRVAIARALAQRPKVVLADEPVASLDPEAAEDIMRLLRRLAGEDGLAVLCVLHQVELAYRYADRVVGIRDGRREFDLPRAELSRDAVRRLYLSEAA
ncbi:MAG TPA: ATP-binding cassette domain-containing protein [Alphaproteobacteria bacterium]|jgi:phosphonate transport system ATP-binding protein|nr:ATP-binding cassette domain-containing protein [Alphaproteobacteria bacterium]